MARQLTASSLGLSIQTYDNFASQRRSFSWPEQRFALLWWLLWALRNSLDAYGGWPICADRIGRGRELFWRNSIEAPVSSDANSWTGTVQLSLRYDREVILTTIASEVDTQN